MPKVSIKRLARHGNSAMLVMPRAFCHAMGLLRGDYVEMTLDESNSDPSGGPIVKIRSLYRRPVPPDLKGPGQGVADVQR